MRLFNMLASPLTVELSDGIAQRREIIRHLRQTLKVVSQEINVLLRSEAEVCYPELKGKPLNISVSDDNNFMIITKGKGWKE